MKNPDTELSEMLVLDETDFSRQPSEHPLIDSVVSAVDWVVLKVMRNISKVGIEVVVSSVAFATLMRFNSASKEAFIAGESFLTANVLFCLGTIAWGVKRGLDKQLNNNP